VPKELAETLFDREILSQTFYLKQIIQLIAVAKVRNINKIT
jgi:hypothetical protein